MSLDKAWQRSLANQLFTYHQMCRLEQIKTLIPSYGTRKGNHLWLLKLDHMVNIQLAVINP